MMNFDVAIVGAGIVGAACAAALSREGLSVVIVDANDIATGTTAAGMGHIVVMDDSEAQFALTSYSQKLWKALAEEMPESCEFEHCGTIWIAADEGEMNEVRRKKEFFSSRGIETEILDQKGMRAAEPHLAEDLAGGLLVPNDAVVYQLAATKFLIQKALANGAFVRTGSRVRKVTDNGVELDDGETIAAKKIVNAAGSAASDLTPQLNIKKRKGHLIITERYDGFVKHQLIELGYLKSAHGSDADSVAFNVQPRSTGQVLLGSSRQFDAETSEVDNNIVRRMASRAFEYMPKLKMLSAVRVWTGFRPATRDNLPYIGKIPGFENVYAAAGHEGLGITTSLGTAALLADELMGRTPAIQAEPYRPNRTLAETRA
jgi:glycine/D-amino acid oxidase-like deaminating enzyme